MESINGYCPIRPFTSVGAGTASWTIAEKNGWEFFLKRFNSPKYVPSCRQACLAYEEKKNRLYGALNEVNNGNIVVIEDFFHYDTFYYIATQLVHESAVSAEKIYLLPPVKRKILMKILVHCLVQLEKVGIVHGDLKPSNIMIKPTVGGFYSLKLIDFDSSFFVSDPPQSNEDLEGDMTYMAPEMLMAMCGEEIRLTGKMDVFAVGLMFHYFLCGSLPFFDRGQYNCACEAVANGERLQLSSAVPQSFCPLLQAMLEAEPEKRPDFRAIFQELVSGTSLAVPQDAVSAKVNPWMEKGGDL